MTRLLEQMRANAKNVRYADLAKVCDRYFGEPRQQSGSHRVYRVPWQGDPRVNIQNVHGEAKPYQVRQAVAAIDKLQEEENR